MQKIKFTQLKQPLICTIISDPTPAEIVRTMILSDFDGTDAYEINLMIQSGRAVIPLDGTFLYEIVLGENGRTAKN